MTERILLDDLILDKKLYPRHGVSPGNVARLRQVRAAGRELDPVIVCSSTRVVIDGWHRITAARQAGDPSILAELRDYSSDAERFEAAARLNTSHGLALTSYDRLRVLEIGEQLGLGDVQLADALAISTSYLRSIRPRFATVSEALADGGELRRQRVALKASVRHLSGEEITRAQAAEIEGSAPGTSYLLVTRQLSRAISLGLLPPREQHPALHDDLRKLAELIIALS